MTRPEIIRADSIDLQDQNSPSAQDHSRQPTHPSPLGSGPPAPHQAGALREVAAEAKEQSVRSPRVSKEWADGELQHLQYEDDELAAGVISKLTGGNLEERDRRNAAEHDGPSDSTGEDADMADAEGDDGMDDDMMDKISSSPSIDDGGYFLPYQWPKRSDSFIRTLNRSVPQACDESSSPPMQISEFFFWESENEKCHKNATSLSTYHSHHQGEYLDRAGDNTSVTGERLSEEMLSIRENPAHFYLDEYVKNYNIDHWVGTLAGTLDIINDYFSAEQQANLKDEGVEDVDEHRHVIKTESCIIIPYKKSEDEDDDYDIPYSTDSRFVDSGWGGECLQELEDIDFEFVYALHTFVATVEGQANATKGDTMVLLDDSNSYWWLVRVVKDSSIGYLPAEHIETPTERLARLNKHRNIDLTSAMLGDAAEKSKNPLKKAIRRRNAKTVTFTAPTYVEASDIEYSTEEEEDVEGAYYEQSGQQERNGDQHDERSQDEDVTAAEPPKARVEPREAESEAPEQDTSRADGTVNSSDTARNSDEFFEGKVESKSRNGTLRNTDSFFKDDSVETRKITITPNLLRDDSSTSTRASNESQHLKQRPSLDKLEKEPVSEKVKDKKDKKDKKEKEKKPGMLSGLFKRKEKKPKSSIDDDIDDISVGKQSNEASRTSPSPSKDSEDVVSIEEQPASVSAQDPSKQSSKVQKQPRAELSPERKRSQLGREPKPIERQTAQQAPAPDRAPPVESAQTPSMRVVQQDSPAEASADQSRVHSPGLTRGLTTPTTPKEQKPQGAISKILRSASSTTSDPKPIKAKKAKARVELDDFDSSTEEILDEEPALAPTKQPQRPIPGSFPDSYIAPPAAERLNAVEERLSESPVHVSPMSGTQTGLPPLVIDTSSQEDQPSPISSPSPELIDAEDARTKVGGSTASTSTPTWSDSHLRTFFDDGADIKDLLVVVFDKSGVVPAGPDHPITGNLFKEENAKLADITNRLDGMLGDWLARKMRTQAPR